MSLTNGSWSGLLGGVAEALEGLGIGGLGAGGLGGGGIVFDVCMDFSSSCILSARK